MEKYCTAGQAKDDNMAHAHCMLAIYVYKRKLTSPLHRSNYTDAPQCYVIRTFPVSFNLNTVVYTTVTRL
jgi:hypothetical protein